MEPDQFVLLETQWFLPRNETMPSQIRVWTVRRNVSFLWCRLLNFKWSKPVIFWFFFVLSHSITKFPYSLRFNFKILKLVFKKLTISNFPLNSKYCNLASPEILIVHCYRIASGTSKSIYLLIAAKIQLL